MALVVGATGGVGRAVAIALSDRYTVWLSGRNEAALDEVAGLLPDAHCWPVDLSSGRGLADVPQQLSKLDVLVHCAGLFTQGSINDASMEEWREVFDTNLFGVIELTRNVLPALRATRGRVIIVNSTAISGSPANRAAYAASKAALQVFSGALLQEELDNGIRVTSVHLGRTATRMQRAVRAAEGGPFESDKYLSASSVAAAILWVASAPPDAHFTEFELKPTRR